MPLLTIFLSLLIASANAILQSTFANTAQRIGRYNYPAEIHTVQTDDGYILTLFRIPNSPRSAQNAAASNKSVVFLQHGFGSSSDTWILNGPDNGLPFLLADAGYDVWLGNTRGNTYSMHNINIPATEHAFWNFSFHQVGVSDYPAMFDYVLNATDEKALHFVGHSQGTSAFLALMSMLPHYIEKVKTSHLLAPVAYMSHMRSPFVALAAPFVGTPNPFSAIINEHSFATYSQVLSQIGRFGCRNGQLTQAICANLMFLEYGFDPFHMNYTLLSEFFETLPAGGSTTEILHFVQEYKSGHFRQFDYGHERNLQIYGQASPPDYEVERIQPKAPVQLYYADNDLLSAPADVFQLARRMGANAELYHVEYPLWSHIDYLIAVDVKPVINNRIMRLIREYENQSN